MDLSDRALAAVRQHFYDQGITVVEWARVHGFDVHLVYGVLSGRAKARRGESHQIAVALGLKNPPERSLAIVRNVLAEEGLVSLHLVSENLV